MCELVLPSLAVVEDPQFTALSVSSEHWLKISEVSKTAVPLSTYAVCVFTDSLHLDQYMMTTANNQLWQCVHYQLICLTDVWQVRLPQLPSYLLAMRNAGYQLVGAEQTAQSKCVTTFEFQPRTLLLLGSVIPV